MTTTLISELIEIASFNDAAYNNPAALEVGDVESTMIQRAPLCDLNDLVARAVQKLSATAEEKSVDLDFKLGGTPYIIRGDSSRLKRSVFTLVENAITVSPRGSQVSVLLIFTDTEILLRVSDEGANIPEDDLLDIFTCHSSRRTSTEGQTSIDLGLAIVWSTVEAHRGSMAVRNADEGGVEFIIRLPALLRSH